MSEVEYYEEALMNVAKKLVQISDEIVKAIGSNQALRKEMNLQRSLADLFPSTIGLHRKQNE